MLYAINSGFTDGRRRAPIRYGTGVSMYLMFQELKKNPNTWADLFVVDTSKPYDETHFYSLRPYGVVDSHHATQRPTTDINTALNTLKSINFKELNREQKGIIFEVLHKALRQIEEA